MALDVWQSFADLNFDYHFEIKQKKDKIGKQEEYLKKMNTLRDKGKLSKRRLRELKEKEAVLEKMKQGQKKKDQNIAKVVQKELEETKAVLGDSKTKKTAK